MCTLEKMGVHERNWLKYAIELIISLGECQNYHVFTSMLTSYDTENEKRTDNLNIIFILMNIPIYNDVVKIEDCFTTYCST